MLPVNSTKSSAITLTRCRRAVVVIPPIHDFYATPHRLSGLGAHVVATLLRRLGIEVAFLHFPVMNRKGTPLPLPRELGHLASSMVAEETGKLAFFTSWRRFGPPIKKCAEMIDENHPDCCFFSIFAFAYSDEAIELAAEVKTKMPTVPIVAGGGGPSVFPEYFLRRSCIDFVLTGEAEVSIQPFLREITRHEPAFENVPNLFWKTAGEIKKSRIATITAGSDIEIPIVKSAESTGTVTFATSMTRGCPKQCGFCTSRFVHGRPFRTAPIDAVEEAARTMFIDATPPTKQSVINFEDDNIIADKGFLKSLILLLKRHVPHPEFIAENGIDYELLSPELCRWLLDNGMKKFNISLASTNPDILQKRHRNLRLEQYERIVHLLAETATPNITYFICGFKEDTLETTAHNLSYLSKKQTIIGISPFYAVPRMPGFEDVSRFKQIPSSLCLGSVAYPWNGSLSTETLVTAFRLSRFINLSKYSHRSDIENQLLDLIANKQELYTIIKDRDVKGETIVPVPGQDKELVKVFFKMPSNIG